MLASELASVTTSTAVHIAFTMSQRNSNISLSLALSTAAAAAAASCWLYHSRRRQSRNGKENAIDGSILPQPHVSTTPVIGSSSNEPTQRGPVDEIQVRDNNDDGGALFLDSDRSAPRILQRGTVTIVHASMTGTCAQFAQELYEQIVELKEDASNDGGQKKKLPIPSNVHLASVEDYDWWDELLNDDDDDDDDEIKRRSSSTRKTVPIAMLIVLLPTYTQGTWSPVAVSMQEALKELQNDWRIAKQPLKDKLNVAVFGTGSSEWDQTMGRPAKEAVQAFRSLGAKILTRLQVGDDAVGNHCQETFASWTQDLMRQWKPRSTNEKKKNINTKDSSSKNATNDCGCENSGGGKSKEEACCQSH